MTTGKILITGGLGYLGGRIAWYLKEANSTQEIMLTTRRTLNHLPAWTSNFDVQRFDLTDTAVMYEVLKDVDTIIHLAAVNEIDSVKDPENAFYINVTCTKKLLEVAVASGVKRILYFSTYHVYDKHIHGLIREDSLTCIDHPYAASHLMAEEVVHEIHGKYNLPTLILRLSNGYGYPMDVSVNRWMLVFNNLCYQAVSTNRIKLHSSGEQHRDFISLEDVARVVEHFLFHKQNSWADGLFNIGGECSMSILDVANRIARVYQEVSGKKIDVVSADFFEASHNHGKNVEYSIKKLKETGFVLQGNMNNEIKKTLEKAAQLANG